MKHVAILSVVLFFFASSLVAHPTDQDRAKLLEKERERFEKETDPVSRTKIGIKISDILLEDVAQSVKEGEFDVMETQLTAYADTIQTAHNSLVESGRNAQKKPNGFKELEIALRKHVRKLEDFGRVLNLQRRIPLDKAKDLANGIRDKLLKALFP